MTRKWSWLAGALSALTIATTSLSGCVVRGRAAWVVDTAPPQQEQEVQPAPREGYIWIKGRWENQGGRWVWARGYWEQQRQNYVWVDGRWEQRGGQWHWVPGRWEQGGGGVTVGGGGTADVMWEVEAEPPAPQMDQPNEIRPGYIWIRGAWEYRGGQWQWRTGYWEAERQGNQWIEGRWDRRGNRFVWVPGSWSVNVNVGGNVQVDTAPPAPQIEQVPAPRQGYVWITGRWDWAGGRWQWKGGYWQQQQQNRVWVQGKWQNVNNRWMWVEGHWE